MSESTTADNLLKHTLRDVGFRVTDLDGIWDMNCEFKV